MTPFCESLILTLIQFLPDELSNCLPAQLYFHLNYVHPQPFSFATNLNSEDREKEYHSLQICIYLEKSPIKQFEARAFLSLPST